MVEDVLWCGAHKTAMTDIGSADMIAGKTDVSKYRFERYLLSAFWQSPPPSAAFIRATDKMVRVLTARKRVAAAAYGDA